MIRMNRILAALGAVLLGLAGCGGGGGGSGGTTAATQAAPPPTTAQPTGIEGTGRLVSRGAITAFGSIFVNGVELSTTTANITVEGQTVPQSGLGLGDVVTVVGTLDAGGKTGKAETVTYSAPLVGPVQSIDPATATLVVLGQRVQVDGSTQFEATFTPQSISAVQVGDDLRISGFRDSAGAWIARRIDRRKSATPLVATGAALSVDATARRLTIGQLVVDWSSATLANFTTGSVANGDFVRVEGTALAANGTLTATRVARVDSRLPASTGDNGQLQGNVTRFASATDFDVDGYRITTDASTKFNSQDPAGFGGLRLDRFVTVVGVLLADGRLLATNILTNNLVTIAATIESSTPLEIRFADRQCVTAAPTYTIDGQPGTASSLRPGDVATLYQSFGANEPLRCHTVVSNRLVRGPVETVDAARGRLTVLGQSVAITAATRVLESTGANELDALASLAAGDVVEIAGYRSSDGTVNATRLDRPAVSAPRQVVGNVATIDTVARKLAVGRLTVDWSAASPTGFPGAAPTVGQRVIVRGSQDASGALRATALEYDSPQLRGTEVGPAHIFGPITAFRSARDFDVEGRNVQPAPDNGVVAGPDWECTDANLAIDTFVTEITAAQPLAGLTGFFRVRSWFGSFGTPFGGSRAGARFSVDGRVESIDAANRTLVIAGLPVTVQPLTQLRTWTTGQSCPAPLTFAGLAVGNWVSLAGGAGPGAATLLASSVERNASPAAAVSIARLSGPVQAVLADGLRVGGIHVVTSAATAYFDCGAAVSSDEFTRNVRSALATGADTSLDLTTTKTGTAVSRFEASQASTCLNATARSGPVQAQVVSASPDVLTLDLAGLRVRVAGPGTGVEKLLPGQFVELLVRWDASIGDLYVVTPIQVIASGGQHFVSVLPDAYAKPNFTLLGKTIVTNASTEFRQGTLTSSVASTAEDFFASDAWIIVATELATDANGTLVAKRVTFEAESYF